MWVLLECGYYSREGLIWGNTVYTVLSENFGTLQTLSHMYDVVPKWLKKCTVRALKCYLHLIIAYLIGQFSLRIPNKTCTLFQHFYTITIIINWSHIDYSVLVASNTVLLKGGLFTEMMTLLAAKKPNGFDFSDIQIIRLFLLFTFVLIHQPVSKKTKNKRYIYIYFF